MNLNKCSTKVQQVLSSAPGGKGWAFGLGSAYLSPKRLWLSSSRSVLTVPADSEVLDPLTGRGRPLYCCNKITCCNANLRPQTHPALPVCSFSDSPKTAEFRTACWGWGVEMQQKRLLIVRAASYGNSKVRRFTPRNNRCYLGCHFRVRLLILKQ